MAESRMPLGWTEQFSASTRVEWFASYQEAMEAGFEVGLPFEITKMFVAPREGN